MVLCALFFSSKGDDGRALLFFCHACRLAGHVPPPFFVYCRPTPCPNVSELRGLLQQEPQARNIGLCQGGHNPGYQRFYVHSDKQAGDMGVTALLMVFQ